VEEVDRSHGRRLEQRKRPYLVRRHRLHCRRNPSQRDGSSSCWKERFSVVAVVVAAAAAAVLERIELSSDVSGSQRRQPSQRLQGWIGRRLERRRSNLGGWTIRLQFVGCYFCVEGGADGERFGYGSGRRIRV
jgi:hypothetical protein